MSLGRLQYLLFDCTGAKAKRGYYIAGCFISALAIVASLASLLSFSIDYLDGQALYHSLPYRSHCIGYVLCLIVALIASVPPLVLGVFAVNNLPHYENQQTFAARLCGAANFDNFHCHGSATRYLLLATLSAATIILSNTLSVCILHAGVGRLFQHNSVRSARVDSAIDQVQQRLSCCGLNGPDDWRRLGQQRGLPTSCAVAVPDDGSVELPNNLTLVSSDGCAATLTGEHAIVRGIGNMLAFAGVLLLLAAWTRVERVAELTAKDVSNLFKEPRAPAEAAAFVEQIGRKRSSRLSTSTRRFSTASQKSWNQPEATSERSTIRGFHASGGHYQRHLLSTGFLYPSDEDVESRQIVGRAKKISTTDNNSDLADLGSGVIGSTVTYTGSNSSSSSGSIDKSRSRSRSGSKSPSQDVPHGWSHLAGQSPRAVHKSADCKNNNNSALDLSQPWLGAQVINSLVGNRHTGYSDESEDEEYEESMSVTDSKKDAVQMTNETMKPQAFKQLDVKGLEDCRTDNCCSQRRVWIRRDTGGCDYETLPILPVFLFDHPEERWRRQLQEQQQPQHQQLDMLFSTCESGNF